MRREKYFIGAGFFTLLVMAAVSCGKLDVVGKDSASSFQALLNAASKNVMADEMNGGWSIAAPDSIVRFVWSKNYAESPLHDVMLEFDAAPFIEAGLDPERLPENFAFYDGKIMVGTKLGQETLTYNGDATPFTSYEKLVQLKRKSIAYHSALDHYGIDMTGGNQFHWAKNMNTNDKDMVFVLAPEPFITAGLDPKLLKGWMLGKVTVDGNDGKHVEVDKILKAVNLL
jgi:hypothetical protein